MRRSNEARALTDDDASGWFQAATKRPPTPTTREGLRHHMHRKNPIRWARLQRDFAWMMREMKKLGMNPEDARWLP